MDGEWLPYLKDCGISPVFSTPLSEVFSIKVFPDSFADHETCKVYGEINIIYERDTSFLLYLVASDVPQHITLEHNTLPICMLNECNLSSNWSRLTIRLFDGIDGRLIVDDGFAFEKLTNSTYDEVKTVRLHGPGGHACVEYTTFFAAVLCYVTITIDKKDRTEEIDKLDVYGSITAHYTNTYGREFPGIRLFEEIPDCPYSLELSQNPIDLDRYWVVVPGYSFFRVDVKLYNSHSKELLVSCEADLEPTLELLPVKLGSLMILLSMLRRSGVTHINWKKERNVKREPDHKLYPTELIEVFGVMICHNVKDVLKLCGKILVGDGDSITHQLFNRASSLPRVLSSNREMIPLESPSKCYWGHDDLAMKLDLSDIDGKAMIIGNLAWLRESLQSPVSFFDRRICSISVGVNCYAAVFYSMFSEALQAHIEVLFVPNGDSNGVRKVYGTIVTRYSHEDYCSEYEKSYYQSIIFKRSSRNSLKLKSMNNVPLLKTVVAVPTSASLIVEADLLVVYDKSRENLKAVSEFDSEKGIVTTRAIDGTNCSFNLSVEWSSVGL